MPPLLELCRAMHLLLQAHEYADELDRNPWDFAVRLACLRETGLTLNDIRWLIYRGFLVPGVETAKDRRIAGVEGMDAQFRLGPESCFLLTATGLDFAREQKSLREVRSLVEQNGAGPENHHPVLARPPKPEWKSCRRTLLFDESVVKQFKVPAPNQEIVLATFEEEDWPLRIDDPLPQNVDIVAKQRLHDTITSLNRNQKNPLLRFFGDGSGEAICWEARKAN